MRARRRAETPSPARVDPVEAQVETLLAAAERPLSLDELVGRSGRQRWQVQQALNALRAAGRAERLPGEHGFPLAAELRWRSLSNA